MASRIAARIAKRRAEVFPLTAFPQEKQAEIAADIASPTPPPRWIALGPSDCPRPMAYIESRSWYEWHWERGIDPDNKRDPLPPNLRAAVIDRDGYVCQICGGDIEPTDLHIDHIKPWSKGGRHTLGNLQATHSVCNLKKGDRVDGED